MSTLPALGLALALLLGNAFFVAAEFALVSARRTQIEPLADAEGEVRLYYRPASLVAGGWIAAAALLVMGGIALRNGLSS